MDCSSGHKNLLQLSTRFALRTERTESMYSQPSESTAVQPFIRPVPFNSVQLIHIKTTFIII